MLVQVQFDRAEQGLSYYNLNQLPLHFSFLFLPCSPSLRFLPAVLFCLLFLTLFFRLVSHLLSRSPILPPLLFLQALSLNIAHSPSFAGSLSPLLPLFSLYLCLSHILSRPCLPLSLCLLLGCRVHCSDSCCYSHQLQPPRQPFLWRREHGDRALYCRLHICCTSKYNYQVFTLL